MLHESHLLKDIEQFHQVDRQMLSSECHEWGIRFKMLCVFVCSTVMRFISSREESQAQAALLCIKYSFQNHRESLNSTVRSGRILRDVAFNSVSRSIHLLYKVIASCEKDKYEKYCQWEKKTLGADGGLEVGWVVKEGPPVSLLYRLETEVLERLGGSAG